MKKKTVTLGSIAGGIVGAISGAIAGIIVQLCNGRPKETVEQIDEVSETEAKKK